MNHTAAATNATGQPRIAAMSRLARLDVLPSIAILDDEEHVRVALRRLCDAYGLRARTFATAQQLLDAIVESQPQCLILDVQMPGLGGLDAQAALRERGLNIPAIVITGRDDDETRARSAALGAHAYLCKPVDADVLMDAIRRAVGDDQLAGVFTT